MNAHDAMERSVQAWLVGDTRIEAQEFDKARSELGAHRPHRPAGARRAQALRRAAWPASCSSLAKASRNCVRMPREPNAPTPTTCAAAHRRKTSNCCRRHSARRPRLPWQPMAALLRCARSTTHSRDWWPRACCSGRSRQSPGDRAGGRCCIAARLAPAPGGLAAGAGATRRAGGRRRGSRAPAPPHRGGDARRQVGAGGGPTAPFLNRSRSRCDALSHGRREEGLSPPFSGGTGIAYDAPWRRVRRRKKTSNPTRRQA